MSKYATIQGELHFSNSDNYKKAKEILLNGGWVNGDQWMNECNKPEGEFEESNNTIIIPLRYYRNLIYKLNDLVSLSSANEVYYATTDGCFEGGEYINGNFTHFDLEEWAKTHGLDKNRPIENKFSESRKDEYWELYMDWKNAVCDAFMDCN